MNRGSMMRMVIGVGLGLLVAAPDGARADDAPQGGCGAAGQFVAEMASEQGPGFGELSSELAGLGLRDEFAHGLHSAFCEPGA
jgi:hypothetical protein